MFAIVKIAGKQYKVAPDEIIDVDRVAGEEGDTLSFTDVLLKDNDGTVTVGEPMIPGAAVTVKLLKHFRGEKIDVRRYKSKVRHRRHIGFRAEKTTLQITAIS